MPSLDEIVAGGGTDEEVLVDLSGAVEFERVPDGEYQATISDVEAGVSKEGNPKLTWTFVITDEGPAHARQMLRHTPTTGKGAGLTKQVLKALGVDTDAPELRVRPSSYVGKNVTLVVGEQKGTEFSEIKKVRPPKSDNPLA